ncbi:hypothetical protein [Candidatus Sororendozoicomonas aggregata]|uniref:ATP-grasp domain-containing protein n=1 Tax=Candidatus Sororendozoicomonas aggregata TaxID=3073239 RepID=UPI002ED09973
MDVLFVSGIADDNQVKAVLDDKGQFQYLLNGSSSVAPSMEKSREFRTRRFILAGANGRQRYAFPFKPAVIFNEISDADTHGQALSRCIAFCKQQGVPVINPPEAIKNTRRDQVADILANIEGVTVPKTIRFIPHTPEDVKAHYEAHFCGPVLLREAGLHGGKSLTRIENAEQLEQTLYRFAIDGRPYYMSAFKDYKDEQGHYRKYRIVVVEGVPHLRHMMVDQHWMVHRTARPFMAKHAELLNQERALINTFHKDLGPRLGQQTEQIAERLKLDYFGIDCHLDKNDNMLIFEANANMNILINSEPTPNLWESPIAAIREHLKGVIQARSQV